MAEQSWMLMMPVNHKHISTAEYRFIFQIPSKAMKANKITFEQFPLQGERKKGWLINIGVEIQWDQGQQFKVRNRVNYSKDSLTFDLVMHQNGQCTSQPHFQSHDPLYPILLRMVCFCQSRIINISFEQSIQKHQKKPQHHTASTWHAH